MNNMLKEALRYAKIPQLALAEVAFAAGLPENEITNPEQFIFPRGYCYRGFREFPPYLRSFDLSANKKVLLIRDPRDMLVSDYFSAKYSHGIPKKGSVRGQLIEFRNFVNTVDVNSYCLAQAGIFKAEFEGYKYIADRNLRTYKYEDVIFNKAHWLTDMLTYFGVVVSSNVVEAIAKAHDIRPSSERPSQHIRQVTPGNFRKHLSAKAIQSLNSEFREIIEQQGYSDS